MDQILHGIPGAQYCLYHVIVTGASEQLEDLKKVVNLWSNPRWDKCEFLEPIVAYRGYAINVQGMLEQTPPQLQGVKASRPHDVPQLRSFVAFVVYHNRFPPTRQQLCIHAKNNCKLDDRGYEPRHTLSHLAQF